MEKFELDYKSLSNVVDPDTNRIPLKGNEHRIIRVAFDMVRFKDSGPEELWQIQSNDDGEFLVRTFDLGDEENVVTSNWKVMLDKKEENITVAYNNVPIKRVACKKHGVTDTKESWLLRDTIYERLNNDEGFIRSFYFSLPFEKQAALKEIVAWKDFTAEEIKTILEQAGGSVEYRPSTYGFSYLVSFPNGYKLSVIPYGGGMGDVSIKEKPLEGERWDTVECMVKDSEDKDVNPTMLGVRHDGWGVFAVDVSELAAVAKRLATSEYGNLPSLDHPGWGEDEDDEVEAADQWAMANQMIKLKKHGIDYREYFGEKLEEEGESLGEMDPEEKEEFFEGVDEGWEAENECGEWALAFLELELSKNAEDLETCLECGAPKSLCMCPCPKCGLPGRECKCDNCPRCGRARDKCLCPKCHRCGGGPGECECPKMASDEPCLSKRSMCGECGQEAEDKDEELLEKAYYALEHYVEPGSEKAVDLSGLIYDVEAGSGDAGMLRRMLEEIEEKEKTKEEEPDEELQFVDEPPSLSFRSLMGDVEPEEELEFEEEKEPTDDEADEILAEMKDIRRELAEGEMLKIEEEGARSKFWDLAKRLEELGEPSYFEEMEKEKEEGEQLVDEPDVPLSFRQLVETEEPDPEEELVFEEEEEKKPKSERLDEILDEMRDIKSKLRKQPKPRTEDVFRDRLADLKREIAEIAESEFGTKKPTHLYHSKGFSKSEFLPTAEEYFEELEADDE